MIWQIFQHSNVPDDVVNKIKECLQEEIANQKRSLSYTIEASVGFARWDGHPESFKERRSTLIRKCTKTRGIRFLKVASKQ